MNLSSDGEGVQGAEGAASVAADVEAGVASDEELWFWKVWRLTLFKFPRRRAGGERIRLLFTLKSKAELLSAASVEIGL